MLAVAAGGVSAGVGGLVGVISAEVDGMAGNVGEAEPSASEEGCSEGDQAMGVFFQRQPVNRKTLARRKGRERRISEIITYSLYTAPPHEWSSVSLIGTLQLWPATTNCFCQWESLETIEVIFISMGGIVSRRGVVSMRGWEKLFSRIILPKVCRNSRTKDTLPRMRPQNSGYPQHEKTSCFQLPWGRLPI